MPTREKSLVAPLLLTLALGGCGGPSGTAGQADEQETPTLPSKSQDVAANQDGTDAAAQAPKTALPTCCTTQEELAALDGQDVRLRGTYKKTVVSRRPAPVDLTTPGNAQVTTEATGVMLEVYYEAQGQRSLAEIQAYHGKEVWVTGTLHRGTPTQMHEGMPMQTMIGPYIEVRAIEPVLAD